MQRTRLDHVQPFRLGRTALPESLCFFDGSYDGAYGRGRQFALVPFLGGGRFPPLATGKNRYLHVPPAFQRVDFSRVDLELKVAPRRRKPLRGRPLRAGRGGLDCHLVAELTDRLFIELPTRQFLQQVLGLAKGLPHPGQTDHAPGAHGEIAIESKHAVGSEIALTAVRTPEISAAHMDAAHRR